MKLHILPTGMIQTNCLVLSLADGQALVIDPGADAPAILSLLDREHLRPVGYPLTHGHYDHVCALAEMAQARPAPCFMHPEDLAWAFSPVNAMPPWYTQPPAASRPTVQAAWTTDGAFQIGDFAFRTLHLPGHSPGSVAFHFEEDGILIGGDVLFQGSVGRTDLPGGDYDVLLASLRRLATLPPETRVYPGHGPATTIAQELRSNPFMREAMT